MEEVSGSEADDEYSVGTASYKLQPSHFHQFQFSLAFSAKEEEVSAGAGAGLKTNGKLNFSEKLNKLDNCKLGSTQQ